MKGAWFDRQIDRGSQVKRKVQSSNDTKNIKVTLMCVLPAYFSTYKQTYLKVKDLLTDLLSD